MTSATSAPHPILGCQIFRQAEYTSKPWGPSHITWFLQRIQEYTLNTLRFAVMVSTAATYQSYEWASFTSRNSKFDQFMPWIDDKVYCGYGRSFLNMIVVQNREIICENKKLEYTKPALFSYSQI